MIYQPFHINKDVLCVLKKRPNGELFITYEKLTTPIDSELFRLRRLLDNTPQSEIPTLYESLITDQVLQVIFHITDYSEDLRLPWQDYSQEKMRILMSNALLDRRSAIKKRIQAYQLHCTYNSCKDQADILTYSNCRTGFQEYSNELDENFSVKFKTNFGFGNSSYFYTVLRYKEIDIVPLTLWIQYRMAGLSEIAFCTYCYELQNENWFRALDDIKNACNCYRSSPDHFVKKYLFEEINRFINALDHVSYSNKFTFITSGYRFVQEIKTEILNGDELLDFRGKKISGALSFVEYIRSFEHLGNVKAAIDKIETLNRRLMPALEHAIERLISDLATKETKLIDVERQYKEMNREFLQWHGKKEEFSKQCDLEEIHLRSEQEKRFLSLHPEYVVFEKKYNIADELYHNIIHEINNIKWYLSNFEDYIAAIRQYFAP